MPIAISLARQLSGLVDHWVDLVNLVEVVHTLQQAGNALQTHAGVDVLARQRACDVEVVFLPDDGELLLHEDQVPDLQEAIFIDDRAAIWAILGTAIEPDLAAWPTGARNAHVPVVVEQAAALNPLWWQPGNALPQRCRLVIGVQDGDPDLVRVKPVAAAFL